MEIIHLILGKANPERMNGVNRVVHEMATIQTVLGYRVQVWGITANTVHDYPERVFTTRLFQSYKNPFVMGKELQKALLQNKGNIVVHIHGAFLPRFFSASQFLHKNGIPFIITPHSSYNQVMMQKNAAIKKIYFSLFERRLLNNASTVHLLGQTEWDGLDAIYHNKKSVMIPYGFSRQKNKNQAVSRPDIFTVAYCGRLSIYSKGLDIMLQGFADFHASFPASQLVIIGDGKEKPALLKMVAALGIADAVVFTGSLFGEEKLNRLKASHVFAHPSRTDGIPATIIESASIGLPCIVSKATNTGEYISRFDAGYTMDKLNAGCFSMGLQNMYARIMHKNESALLQQNAFRMIDEAFNWESILAKFDSIYKMALAS